MKAFTTSVSGVCSRAGIVLGLTALALAGAAFTARAAEGAALEPKMKLRALTQTEIAAYKLPAGTQKSGGLATTGVGQPFYLDVLVPHGMSVTNIQWSLMAPAGSAAALAAGPLGSEVPAFEPSDRLVYDVAGRQLLLPDVVGAYSIMATLGATGVTNPVTVGLGVTAANYVGLGDEGANPPQCFACHADKAAVWQQTGHSTIFKDGLDGLASDHYGKNCITCHTVGYDAATNAVNGGFDDVATQLGWTFPTSLQAGTWEALPAALKNLGNIQCENCHGPGSGHVGRIGYIDVPYGSGACAQCHDAMTHHSKQGEWNNSKHAIATRSPSGPGREGCVACHTAIGFIDSVKGNTPARTDYEAINCTACHEPHDPLNPHQLRKIADVTLMNGVKITNGGKGKLCMSCHKSRRNVETYVTKYGSHFGPHYGPQTDMLMGTNAVQYGRAIPSSAHKHIEDSCVTCHMQAVAATAPGFTHVGGHTFNLHWDAGTPEDPADDVGMVTACMRCHGPLLSFDFARKDYDGDGVVEGVQTEVQGLMDQLASLLPNGGEATPSFTPAQLKGAFNLAFVEDDKSHGVHNVPYAVGILKASIADLGGSPPADNGMPDDWEIANFGQAGVDPQADADNDGVDNLHEYLAGTNPKNSDTDGDGSDDRIELAMGTSPVDPNSAPASLTVRAAAEIQFLSKLGKTYQLQKMNVLGATGWVNVGDPIPGTGAAISLLRSTRNADQEYYQVLEQ